MEAGQLPVAMWLCRFGAKSMQRTHIPAGSILITWCAPGLTHFYAPCLPWKDPWHDI